MNKKVFVVTGLGYGDEGKGTATHWLSVRHHAHTVMRVGGPQALHYVVCANGGAHTFSQFGSGTLRGSATHLSKYMVIDPHAILEEGNVLAYELGIRNALQTLTIHEDALVITPFQAIAGRLRELMRGKDRYGSVGIGVGETVLDADVPGSITIRAGDLSKPGLRDMLYAVQRRKIAEFEALMDRLNAMPNDIEKEVRLELAELQDPDTVQWAIERFTELARRVRIVDTAFVAEEILGPEGSVVIEGSQGVLLDRWYGFHPYTTKVRTTPESALALLDECRYDGDIESIGVLRAYHTRHGGGPFVTESSSLTKRLPDTTNRTHPWQGSFRVGHFDMVAARYAVEACQGTLGGLMITCVDRIPPDRQWKYCGTYRLADTVSVAERSEFFAHSSGAIDRIRVSHGMGAEQLARQETLGNYLSACIPVLTSSARGSMVPMIEEDLGVPVVAVSHGPTEKDKIEIIKKGSR